MNLGSIWELYDLDKIRGRNGYRKNGEGTRKVKRKESLYLQPYIMENNSNKRISEHIASQNTIMCRQHPIPISIKHWGTVTIPKEPKKITQTNHLGIEKNQMLE